MSAQAVREFIDRHMASSAGLASLAAALDAQVNGTPLDPALAARVQELLTALGAGDALTNVGAQEGRTFLAEIRHHLPFDVSLMWPETRATSWTADDRVLRATGDFARGHAHALTRAVVPALEGLADRFKASTASFLDIGVGVGGLAVQLAELWPNLHIVGIDVFQPSLRIAHEQVAAAGLGDRIELREQSGDKLEDESAFDLAWVPMIFIPERVLAGTTERTHRSLRPGGWAVYAFANFGAFEPTPAAFWRLRTTMWGGPLWTPPEVEKHLRDHGFVDTRALPAPPGSPVVLVAGRRKPS